MKLYKYQLEIVLSNFLLKMSNSNSVIIFIFKKRNTNGHHI